MAIWAQKCTWKFLLLEDDQRDGSSSETRFEALATGQHLYPFHGLMLSPWPVPFRSKLFDNPCGLPEQLERPLLGVPAIKRRTGIFWKDGCHDVWPRHRPTLYWKNRIRSFECPSNAFDPFEQAAFLGFFDKREAIWRLIQHSPIHG